ncbi:MAG: thioredoxin domain-containing protein [Candidatus Nanopelagicales bacterium]|nr:thioredoxin domain-containing protein [Candidatus Nanopelagicales bacterium]MDZ4250810.1 thioredoxin domain-containing protein [Candidatus Nanopelagicales bacterium]
MASTESSRARKRAAEARAAAEAAQNRRQRLINIGIGAVLVVVVVGLVGGAWWSSGRSGGNIEPSADAVLPQGVLAADSPYAYGVVAAKGAAQGKPVVEIWEDFQCPACEYFEKVFGETVTEMAKSGDAEVIWRTIAFLDSNIPGQNSKRAMSAWGCAIDEGKKDEYHEIVFANQPTEGVGWTNDQLISFGAQAGIKGDRFDPFKQCVVSETYFGWSVNSTDQMRIQGITGTPTVVVNGKKVAFDPSDPDGDIERLKKAVAEAGAPQS